MDINHQSEGASGLVQTKKSTSLSLHVSSTKQTCEVKTVWLRQGADVTPAHKQCYVQSCPASSITRIDCQLSLRKQFCDLIEARAK